MKVITVFPLISTPGTYVISKLYGAALEGRKEGSPLKEKGAYFEVRRVIIMKFSGIFMVNFEHISHLVLVSLELTLNM